MAKKRPQHGRTVEINVDKLTAAMDHRGLSVEQLKELAGVSTGTVNNLLAGKPVYRTTATQVAEALETTLGVLMGESASLGGAATVHEYLVSEVLTDWIVASNGLRFQVCRLRHLELDRQARGKRFDLRDMTTDEEQRCRTWIKRHPNVCESLQDHPNIARNLTAFHDPAESFYWVIDEWVDGEPLQRSLGRKQFSALKAKNLLLDVARGLQGLHQQGIIRRELNPTTIIIRNSDRRAILTEFELAKLIDRGPTVSTDDWPVDPYRAGEADADDVDVRTDIYSWARIGIHALIGALPEIGQEQSALEQIAIPSMVRDCLASSAAVFRSERPSSMGDIIPVIEEWSVGS
ncbi:Serine/threonine-protein kinase C [Crateriforma conspicua]|uniref:Serine/threonine-protein kinase C n=1 Tax=Crateriforma conspicua TaxID=2527996 RepID=A0A5C6FPS9_9PLAN|nr:protein kinase [Crateriforma conspicua]TWU62648.1 Serine/threonine-protein kinase C [Crateriforma conspicua]